jgi:hypothetical protein
MNVEKREQALKSIATRAGKLKMAADKILADLGKPHVDNKASAKTATSAGKKIVKGLEAAASAFPV